MTSELKSATARINGAKSRGPKTAATRAKSSRNSIGHGFTARNTIVLECEKSAEFDQMMADFGTTYQPTTPAQENLVDQMVACRWRLDRFLVVETALIDDEMDRIRQLPNNSPDTGIRLSRAIRSLADNSHSLTLVRRYLANLNRSFDKAYSTLRDLQTKTVPDAPPEPPQPTENPEYETNLPPGADSAV